MSTNTETQYTLNDSHVKGAMAGFVAGIAVTIAFFVGFLTGRN